MIEYAELESCYREFILSYFGEARVKNYCGFCGNCRKQKDVQDFSLEAKKFFPALAERKKISVNPQSPIFYWEKRIVR
ncbi:hypothetical protein HMPREF9466_01112 [Fusobacterium necrophorum subsp. funduliforme 1_1_36S]|nr:hypothetical protein HMPREF9466_01112 [Fusobacterium necrophorum subsp. funduliforme 1_1_36S]